MKGQISYPSCFREGKCPHTLSFGGGGMSTHSFSGRGKCPPLFFQGGANVLHLVFGRANVRGECPGGNVLHSATGNGRLTNGPNNLKTQIQRVRVAQTRARARDARTYALARIRTLTQTCTNTHTNTYTNTYAYTHKRTQ